MEIINTQKTMVEEDKGLLTPGSIVTVKFEPGEILDMYYGLLLIHANNNQFACLDKYTFEVFCSGTLDDCRKKFNEMQAEMEGD